MAERNLDFNRKVDRHHTGCLKYDFAKERNMPEDILPLWVADMDFETSSYIQDAVTARTAHGIFGYSEAKEDYYEALRGWMKRHHGWEPETEWVIKTPGVVFALAMAVRAYTGEGDGVLVQSPVYYPFYEVIRDNNRRVVSSDLQQDEDGIYRMNTEDFEKKIVEEKIRLFILCNPHNPVGRVWEEEELRAVGDICLKHGVTVVSDEIHMDFDFAGKHSVFANIRPEYAGISITCTSPSKTFNLAGMNISNIIIPDEKLRRRFQKQVDAAGISQLGTLSLVACEAAYTHGEEWYAAMKKYVKENIDFAAEYVKKHLPGVTMVPHQGTYLIWLDFRGTGLAEDELEELIIHKAKLWLDSGKIFGKTGKGFQRINAACPRSTLEEALARIASVL